MPYNLLPGKTSCLSCIELCTVRTKVFVFSSTTYFNFLKTPFVISTPRHLLSFQCAPLQRSPQPSFSVANRALATKRKSSAALSETVSTSDICAVPAHIEICNLGSFSLNSPLTKPSFRPSILVGKNCGVREPCSRFFFSGHPGCRSVLIGRPGHSALCRHDVTTLSEPPLCMYPEERESSCPTLRQRKLFIINTSGLSRKC